MIHQPAEKHSSLASKSLVDTQPFGDRSGLTSVVQHKGDGPETPGCISGPAICQSEFRRTFLGHGCLGQGSQAHRELRSE